MALTPEEEAELAELEKQVGPEFLAAAAPKKGAVIDQKPTPGSEEGLGGIKAVYGKDWTPYAPGGQPISQTQGDRARDDAAIDAEAERVAGMLDPRFSLVPQILALQPATNDPAGDEAAKAKYQAGQKDAIFIYEPPVDVVRRHLLENPGMLRAISPDEVPSVGDIEGLTAESTLYKTAADYMFRKADEAATEKGQKIIRYSKAPWLWSDKGIPETLKLKIQGADSEAANQAQAFVLGVDDMGAAGIMRANQELTEPTTMLTQPRVGLNESVPQSSADVNAWTEQEYPLSYGAGQVVGMLNPRSIFNRVWSGLEEGGQWLAQAAAKTRLGAYAAETVAPVLKSAAGALGDAAVGAGAAATGQLVQEGVDAAGRAEPPDLRKVGERILDVGETGGVLGGLGSGARRLAGAGAEGIRDSPRFTGPRGPGAVRRTEPNMEYRIGREPRLSGETRALVKESSAGGYLPSDALAEEIAGPVGKAAQQNSRVAADRAGAARAGYQASPEGREQLPVRQAFDESFRGVRSHYQPQPDGRLRAIDDRPPPEQKVFNSLIGDVSVKGGAAATKLTPEQAERFLNPRAQAKLLKDDLDAATRERLSKPIDRQAYLGTKSGKARAGVDEEIEAEIDELFKEQNTGTLRDRPIDKRGKPYKDAEQQALRDRVGAEVPLEPFGGSLGKYLEQRGIDAVYVTPRALDAERLDRLIELHGADSALGKAAQFDRRQFSAGGKKGGYHELLDKQGAEAARHAQIEKSVAPGGDAFQPIAGLYRSNPGEKQLVDSVRALASQSGVSEQLERLRGLQETLAIQNRASFRGPQGQTRSPFAPQNVMDAAQLRLAFPALKSLEGPLGPLRGSTAGRPALMGGGETEAAQRRAESGPRGRYEAARDRRLKEIADEKAADSAAQGRRQSEQIRRRR